MISLKTANIPDSKSSANLKPLPDFFSNFHSPTIKNIPPHSTIVLLGIGGSALGAKCLMQALKPDAPLYVLDNIDPQEIQHLEKKLDPKETLFLNVSKSGETIETQTLTKYFKEKSDLFLTISDPKNSPDYEIPTDVPGRFSIFTPAALIPAQLIGIDTEKLIKGAQNSKDEDALRLAQIQFELYKQGKIINVIMPYSNQLIGLTDWYRQLLAESIGKNKKTGITPVTALGATDQHSQLQLYAEGPQDKLVIFIEVENLPGPPEFQKLLRIEKQATEQTLTKKDRPNLTITLDSITEESLGSLIMTLMKSVAYLGQLFEVNPFDQPGVEYTKKLIKESL